MTRRPVATPSLGGLVVATMFRGDPRQLVEWCNFHLNAGADRLYVALDRPDPALVEALPAHPAVHWEILDEETWESFYAVGANVERKQVDAVRWLARRARAEGHEHLAFIDTDELLDLAVPFADLAARHPEAPAIVLPVREMWYAEGGLIHEPFGATLALGQAPRGFDWKRAFGWRAQYFGRGMLGHDLGKTVYRLPFGSGQFSVHLPLSGSLQADAVAVTEDSARLLHFDCGTFTTWSTKWGARLTGDVVARGLGPHRRAQLRLFEHVMRRAPEDQERFFERFYSIDPATAAELEHSGMVEHIDLTAFLEGPLPIPSTGRPDVVTRLPPTAGRRDMQFAMVCDRNFVEPTFATMISVLSQVDPAKTVRFVVLGDALRATDVHHLKSLEYTSYEVEVLVFDITRNLNRDLGVAATGVSRSRATYGRAYLADFLPEQRTVYLDGDVLATRDISELFDLDLADACIAGVPDSAALRLAANPEGVPVDQRMRLTGMVGDDPLEYLNAGVLVLDLDHPDFHELWLLARAYVTMEGRALVQHDQDAINLAFAGRKHRLSSRYNYMTQFYTSDRCLDGDLVSAKYQAADASLIHFSGRTKPWLTPRDEFYNGLYRKIVSEAEARLGVGCGFYFSRHVPRVAQQWSTARWAANLGATGKVAVLDHLPARRDVKLVDVTDSHVYLQLTPDAYLHAVAHELHLVARSDESELFRLPLELLSPQQTHLGRRVGSGIRTLPVDLVSALSAQGGVARHVELALSSADGGVPFERSLEVLDVLAAGSAATPELLGELAMEGVVEGLEGGSLRVRYRAASDNPLSLHIAGELVALRAVKADEHGLRTMNFRASHMVLGLGYGAQEDDELSVRVPTTNVPLPGVRVTVGEVGAERATTTPASQLLGRSSQVAASLRRRLRRR